MAFSKKNRDSLDKDQRELYDYARRRSLQKKRLLQHFIIFLIGSVFLIILNVLIGFKQEVQPLGYDWFVWAVLLWAFIVLVHFFNVFVTDKFMGKKWEDRQLEKLVKKQRARIEELQKKVERDHPLPESKPKSSTETRTQKSDPDKPQFPYND